MHPPLPGFGERLKRAVTGAAGTPLVFLGNFEVENQWAVGEPALPRFASPTSGAAVVNRMDEFALLLGGKDDHVVLKAAPDPGYLAYLEKLGLALPTVHTVSHQEPALTVTEDVLRDTALLRRLGELGAEGAMLSAHGISAAEEELCARAGLAAAAPPAAVCKRVNSKVYSRRLADELGLRSAPGWACETLAELAAAVTAAAPVLDAGRKVVVKDAFGVSGKGIVVVDSARRLARLERMAATQARKGGGERVALVVEEWVAKRADLNYQFTVARDGSVRFDFAKELQTRGGVHMGHRFPARLSAAQVEELREAAALLGGRLAADGYFGVVGVDAMVGPDERLYPVVEINARNNMSTYQAVVHEALLAEDHLALARHYPVTLTGPRPFDQTARLLDGLLLTEAEGQGREGLFVNNHATVNAGAPQDGEGPFDGRLYGVLIAGSDARLEQLDSEITRRLDEAAETGRSTA